MIRSHLLTFAFTATLALLAAAMPSYADDAQWGYTGANAPQAWADLNADNALCNAGLEQSPINLKNAEDVDLPPLNVEYKEGNADVLNNGRTIQVNAQGSGGVLIGEEDYNLLQFHFHTPSEHYVDARPYPMELHMLHRAEDGRFGMIAVFITLGDDANPAIETLWSAAQTQAAITFSAQSLLPENLDYYKYQGSLATPPCTENIAWYILKTPITISQAQLNAFQAMFPLNARPVQALNDRVVRE